MNSQFLPLDGENGDMGYSLGEMWGDPRNDHFWWQCVFFQCIYARLQAEWIVAYCSSDYDSSLMAK